LHEPLPSGGAAAKIVARADETNPTIDITGVRHPAGLPKHVA